MNRETFYFLFTSKNRRIKWWLGATTICPSLPTAVSNDDRPQSVFQKYYNFFFCMNLDGDKLHIEIVAFVKMYNLK